MFLRKCFSFLFVAESMSKYAKSGEPDITSPTVSWETTPADTPEPTSILRKRKNTEGEKLI
jgi:hypothetical protein